MDFRSLLQKAIKRLQLLACEAMMFILLCNRIRRVQDHSEFCRDNVNAFFLPKDVVALASTIQFINNTIIAK